VRNIAARAAFLQYHIPGQTAMSCFPPRFLTLRLVHEPARAIVPSRESRYPLAFINEA
jgi:hypothetical protein